MLGTSTANFTADTQAITIGQSVTFTSTSDAGGTNYAWTFGDGTPVVSGAASNVTHSYSGGAGAYTVALTVTYPDPNPAGTVTKEAFITVTPSDCDVPSLKNEYFDSATDKWQGDPYKFTGKVRRAAGAPADNFKIKAQSITAGDGAKAPCNSDVYVSAP